MAVLESSVTVEDWERLEVPEGYTAEIIGGELVVAPSGTPDHGFLIARLIGVLAPQLPPDLTLATSLEWRLQERGIVAFAPQPDVMVVPAQRVPRIIEPPRLGVEVLSPSDGVRLLRSDRVRIEAKRFDYARFGMRDYIEVRYNGVVHIDRYELRDDVLVVVDSRAGDEELNASRPFPYRIVPAHLLPM